MNHRTRSSSHAFLSSIELNQEQKSENVKILETESESNSVDVPRKDDTKSFQTVSFSPSSPGGQRSAGTAFRGPAHRVSPARIRPSSSPGPALLCKAQAQASVNFLLNISLSSPASPPVDPISCPSSEHSILQPISTGASSKARQLPAHARPDIAEHKTGGCGRSAAGMHHHQTASFSRSVDFLSSISLSASPPFHGDAVAAKTRHSTNSVDNPGQPSSARRSSTPPKTQRATPSPMRPTLSAAAATYAGSGDLSPLSGSAAATAADTAWAAQQRIGRPAATAGASHAAAGTSGRGRGGGEREREEAEGGTGGQWARLLLDNLALAAWPLAQSPPDSPTRSHTPTRPVPEAQPAPCQEPAPPPPPSPCLVASRRRRTGDRSAAGAERGRR